MSFTRPATPGTAIAFTATILSALVLAGSTLKSVSLFTAESTRFGPLGFCDETGCKGPSVGYHPDSISVPKWLTSALVLHIPMLILSFLATIFGLIAHRREWATTRMTSITCGLAALVTVFAFIFDMALWGVAKGRAHSAAPGPGTWLTLATWILLLIASCCFFFARRSTAVRQTRDQDKLQIVPSSAQDFKSRRPWMTKKAQTQPVILPAPAVVEEQPLAPENVAGRGAANFQSARYPPTPVPPPRTEVGLPAFPERIISSVPPQRREGLPAFPEVEFDQVTAESHELPTQARIEGNQVVPEGSSRLPGHMLPRADGYVSGRTGFSTTHVVGPRRQPSGQTTATPYGLPSPPEHTVPRRQRSDPTYFTTTPTQQAPIGYARPTPPTSPPHPTATAFQPNRPSPPFSHAGYTSPPPMPSPHHDAPANQYAQETPPLGVRPGLSTWTTQSSAYYTPYTPGSFHQQYSSAPAAVEYDHSPQGHHNPRGYTEYLGGPMLPSRQSYYTPPAFTSDPYNPDGLTMPAAYQGEAESVPSPNREGAELNAVARANQYLSSQLSELLYDNAAPSRSFAAATTSPQAPALYLPADHTPSPQIHNAAPARAPTSSTPPLPPKPISIYWDDRPPIPHASGSNAPLVPPRPWVGCPDSVSAPVMADSARGTVRSHQDESLPAYEEPFRPSGSDPRD